MPTSPITETDLTTPKTLVTMEYPAYTVELLYDNGVLTQGTITPVVPETDPEYCPQQTIRPSKSIARVLDAFYDYNAIKGKPVSITTTPV